jgi:predicted DsbA family dithiol-disulfide isomerase
MTHLHIDIVSDIACPWCAIGFARLRQAMAQVSDNFDITYQWRAFELDSEASSQPILTVLARKYGRSEDDMRAAQIQMMEIANDLGLNFEKMQQRYTANTFNAHRLIKWATPQERATALSVALFDAYFGRAEDVGAREVLLGCVESAGLDRSQAAMVLDGNDYAEEVRQEEARYQNAGVHSVPAFIIDQRYIISGAQESDIFVQAFRDIAAEKRQDDGGAT